MNSKRFSNVLGEDYNIFNKAVPHHDEFQNKIGEIIKDYSASLRQDSIQVVEGGTGTGITTLKILEANDRINILGIDNEKKTLDQAKIILEGYKNRVSLTESDLLEALKKLPASFADIFVSAWVIHNLPPDYRKKLFPEIARVLKKGGLFINGDKYARDTETLHAQDLENQIKAFDVFTEISRRDMTTEWTKHYYEDDKIKITEKEQVEILNDLGFENTKISYRQGMEAILTTIRT